MADNILSINKARIGHQYGNVSGKLLGSTNIAANPGAFMISEQPVEGSNDVRHDIFIQGRHIAGGYGLSSLTLLKTLQNQLKAYVNAEQYPGSVGLAKPGVYYYKLDGSEYTVLYFDESKNQVNLADIEDIDTKLFLINGSFYVHNGIKLYKISAGAAGTDLFKPYAKLNNDTLTNMHEVGGIELGEFTLADLKQKTISEILCEILFPLHYPVILFPNATQIGNPLYYWGETITEADAGSLFEIFNGSISLDVNEGKGWGNISLSCNTKNLRDEYNNLYKPGYIIRRPISSLSINGSVDFSEGTEVYTNWGFQVEYPYEDYIGYDSNLISGSTPVSYVYQVKQPVLPVIAKAPSISSSMNNNYYQAGTTFAYIEGENKQKIINSVQYNRGSITLAGIEKTDMYYGSVKEYNVDTAWLFAGAEYSSIYAGGSNQTSPDLRSYVKKYSVTTNTGTSLYALGNGKVYLTKEDDIYFTSAYTDLCTKLNLSSVLNSVTLNSQLQINTYFPFYFKYYTNALDDTTFQWTYLGESKTSNIEILTATTNASSKSPDVIQSQRPCVAIPAGKTIEFYLFNAITNKYDSDVNTGWQTTNNLWYSFAMVLPGSKATIPLTETRPSGIEGKDYVAYNVWLRNSTTGVQKSQQFLFKIK